MPSAICPECDERVYVDADTEQGDIISCEECDTELEVVGLDPIELDPFIDDEEIEDYGEDYDIFDDDAD